MSVKLPPDFCPYKGLQPYTEADRAFFFGRERDAAIIISNLYASPLTILYGASGVGKSSALLAGAAPQLRETPRVAVGIFRSWQDAGFVSGLKQAVMEGVSTSTGRALDLDTRLALDEFLLQAAKALRGPIFLILDQFEEYFLYHPLSQGSEGFEAELARAVNRRDVDVNFLLSMREDGLSKLDRFQGRIPNLLNNMLRLEHLDRAGADDAIRKPLDEYNRQTNGQPPMSVEDELVEALLQEMKAGHVALDQTGRIQVSSHVREAVSETGIETPFLQMVLIRLWEEERAEGSCVLRLSTLKRLGGPANIARTHLDRQMEKLSEAERSLAARLFRYLVTPSGAKIAQEPVSLASWAEVREEQVQSLLDRLSAQDTRILRTVSAAGQPVRYEIFHDVLARAALDWQTRRRLTRERERVRRLRIVLALLFASMIALIAFGIYWQRLQMDRILTMRADRLARSAYSERANPELETMLAVAAVQIKRTPEAIAELKRALSSPFRAVLRGHTKRVRAAAFSPDGKFIATVSDDTTAKVWDAVTWLEVDEAVLKHPDIIYSVKFSPDGRFIATACRDKTGRIWEVGSWKEVAVLAGHTNAVRSIAYSSDGKLIVTASEDNTALVWHQVADRWEKAGELKGHTGFVQTASFSPDAKLIVTASRDNTIRIWAVGTWEQRQTLKSTNVVRSAAFSPGGNFIVSGDENNKVIVWRLKNDQCEFDKTLDKHTDFVHSVNFSPDGKFLVTASRDTRAIVWDTATWSAVLTLIGHTDEVHHAAYSPDGQLVVTTSDDWTAQVWKPQGDASNENDSVDLLLERAKTRGTGGLSPDQLRRYQLEPQT